MRVCVVEDEQSLAEMIQLNLELEGYDVLVLRDGEVARNLFESGVDFDLIILDVMLPGVNGVDLCKVIRKSSSVSGIVFYPLKGTTSDRIEGLKAGANDYLPKPFDLEELLLRIGILTQNFTEESVKIGTFEVNFKTYEVFDEGKNIVASLSKKEVGLIRLFEQRNGEVCV